MKQLLFFALATAILSGCTTEPKFRNPVTVKSNDVPLYDGMMIQDKTVPSQVVVLADAGDTLELQDITIAGLNQDTLCIVSLDSKRTRFKNGQASVYVERKHLNIPAATLEKARAGKLHDLPALAEQKPDHLHTKATN
ncbi:lipoprotein [Hymenobacter glacieicola]|uniref:Auto-transporter adhesin head GIN domain-containing protein n=1 Tax=Hymenobacter glacieicola TaxID=1562124 RepID=A0ABQ1WKT2_9BACT|nr:lipoprotein [Hymenobacter glacieicola]GGG34169.1 hypothetical protein GCM10011378_08240 [Hymenobacter glacieicola]